jgi:hypothetical protein
MASLPAIDRPRAPPLIRPQDMHKHRRAGFDPNLRPNIHHPPSKDQTNHHNPGAAFDDARIGTTGWDSDVASVLGPRECQDG